MVGCAYFSSSEKHVFVEHPIIHRTIFLIFVQSIDAIDVIKCHSKLLKQYQCNRCHMMLIGANRMSNVQMFQYSNVPIFQCSNVPMFHWSASPLVHWSIGQLDHWSISQLVHWSISPLVH